MANNSAPPDETGDEKEIWVEIDQKQQKSILFKHKVL